MTKSTKQISPRITNLENASKGQGFNHELPLRRDWEKALDAIHFLLLRKWYYVGIATNTKKGLFGTVVKKGMIIERKRKKLPDELKVILKMKIGTFDNLKSKIREKQVKGGSDKDVWHFTTQWKEFPKGTKVIEVHQPLLKSFISGSSNIRRAFVVMDGKCSTVDLNTTMMLIKKVFESKKYTAKVLKEVSQLKSAKSSSTPSISKIEPKTKKAVGKIDVTKTRMPGSLIVAIRDDHKIINGLTYEERSLLLDYLAKRKKSGEYTKLHQNIEGQIRARFGDD